MPGIPGGSSWVSWQQSTDLFETVDGMEAIGPKLYALQHWSLMNGLAMGNMDYLIIKTIR